MRLLEIVSPIPVENVTEYFDQIKIYKSSTQNGTYAALSRVIPINALDNYYRYLDTTGLITDFYKFTFYKSSNPVDESTQYNLDLYYATLRELKQRLNETGDEDNQVYQTVLATASQMIEAWCNREFKQTIETRYFSGPGFGTMFLNRYPKKLYTDDIVDVSQVQLDYSGGLNGANLTTLILNTHFFLWPQMSTSANEPYEGLDFIAAANFPINNTVYYENVQGMYWPKGYRAIRITGTWGWPIQKITGTPIPAPVTEACLQIASRLYKGRDNAYSKTVGSAELGSLRIKNTVIDGDVKEMLTQYKKATYYGQSKEG